MSTLSPFFPSRLCARLTLLFDVLCYPLLIPSYVLLFAFFFGTTLTQGISREQNIYLLLSGLLNFTLFPLLAIQLLRMLGFVSNFRLRDSRDRTAALLAVSIFYFWAYYVFKSQLPPLLVRFSFAWLCLVCIAIARIRRTTTIISVASVACVFFVLAVDALLARPISITLFTYSLLLLGFLCSRALANHANDYDLYASLAIALLSACAACWWVDG